MVRMQIVIAAWACCAAQAMAATPIQVNFPSRDGTPLLGWLFQPAAQPPRATVVALHGCGGLYASSGPRVGKLNARHQAMADMLVGEGYAVLFPDSLRPRGAEQICTQKIGTRDITQVQRRHDGLAALAWVAAQPWADPKKIAVLGWSHGGSAVLSVIEATHSEVKEVPQTFAAAIAFYPGCNAFLKGGYHPNTRLTLMLGELDDWTPAAPCVALGEEAGAEVHVFPGSYHDFDNPIGAVRLRKDVPNGVHPGQGVHAGANPAARAAAYARLRELLAGVAAQR
ncbi:dienelactone hydrolase family protein [Xylophilus sp. GW821-FHT01B05]